MSIRTEFWPAKKDEKGNFIPVDNAAEANYYVITAYPCWAPLGIVIGACSRDALVRIGRGKIAEDLKLGFEKRLWKEDWE